MTKFKTYSNEQKLIMNVYYSIYSLFLKQIDIKDKECIYPVYGHLSNALKENNWYFSLNYPKTFDINTIYKKFDDIATDLNITLLYKKDKEVCFFKRNVDYIYLTINDLPIVIGYLKLNNLYVEAKDFRY